jgi:hypothetical protein
MTARPRGLVALLAVLVLVACNPVASPSYDVTDPTVRVGPQRTCAELQLSDIRCTLLQLRAATQLDVERPGHGPYTTTLHQEAAPAAGESVPPRTTVVPLIVVFKLESGPSVAVPVHCPREPTGGDQACDPRIQ